MKLKMKIKPETKEKIKEVAFLGTVGAFTAAGCYLIYQFGIIEGVREGRISEAAFVHLTGDEHPSLFLTNRIGQIQKMNYINEPDKVA